MILNELFNLTGQFHLVKLGFTKFYYPSSPTEIMTDDWHPKILDLVLSAVIGIGYPFLANFLYVQTGALIPMLIYYILAWSLPLLRRKSTGYNTKSLKNPPKSFYLNVAIIATCLILAYFARITQSPVMLVGAIFTCLIWAPINASSEQLLWIYIFEAWDLYQPDTPENKTKKWIFRILGILFFMIFVGMIHTMFWVNFLHVVDSTTAVGVIFVILTSVSGIVHIFVWRKSKNMLFTFIPHFLLNFTPILWTGYSIFEFFIK